MWNIASQRWRSNHAVTAAGALHRAALLHLRTHRTLHRSVSTHSTTKVASLMITNEIRAEIRRYFYAEHWKIGTIAAELNVHPDAVRNAIASERFRSTQPMRASLSDPYIGFIRLTLEQHPQLCATRIYHMVSTAATPEASSNSAAPSPACVRKDVRPSCNSKRSPVNRHKSIGPTSAM
jgi:hypothetical protein